MNKQYILNRNFEYYYLQRNDEPRKCPCKFDFTFEMVHHMLDLINTVFKRESLPRKALAYMHIINYTQKKRFNG